jgi:hypothetical protein
MAKLRGKTARGTPLDHGRELFGDLVLDKRNSFVTDLPEGCPERFDWEFLKYVWAFPSRNRPKMLALRDQYQGQKEIHHFTSKYDINHFLSTLEHDTCN